MKTTLTIKSIRRNIFDPSLQSTDEWAVKVPAPALATNHNLGDMIEIYKITKP